MAQDPFTEDYMRGFREGEKHSAPSPETNRQFQGIKSSITNLEKTVLSLKDEVAKLKEGAILTRLATNAIFAFFGLALTSLFVAILNSVLN